MKHSTKTSSHRTWISRSCDSVEMVDKFNNCHTNTVQKPWRGPFRKAESWVFCTKVLRFWQAPCTCIYRTGCTHVKCEDSSDGSSCSAELIRQKWFFAISRSRWVARSISPPSLHQGLNAGSQEVKRWCDGRNIVKASIYIVRTPNSRSALFKNRAIPMSLRGKSASIVEKVVL